MKYRGRFAPSPTGDLHLGTARTALVAWLRARAAGGEFLLRMEDLDAARVVEGSADRIIEDLTWLGLDWDGPIATQSRRGGLYRAAMAKLEAAGRVYACTCSRKEIAEIATAPHGDEAVYPGTCRQAVSHPDRDPALRFKMDDPQAGDFILRRSKTAGAGFAYQLACAVDDSEQIITEVVRGDDLQSSAPRQIAIMRALGHAIPEYVHLPLLLGEDGQRLAKRHGSITIGRYKGAGWAPERVVGLLARSLNLVREGDTIMPAALVGRFDPDVMPKKAVRFDGPWP